MKEKDELKELKDELFAAPIDDWQRVSVMVNRNKWYLDWQRTGDEGAFCFRFISPKKRKYSFYIEDGRLIGTDVARATDARLASYWKSWGDSAERLEAVLRLTPKHILDRLGVLLEAISTRACKMDELKAMHDAFTKFAPEGAVLLDLIKRHGEYIVLYHDECNVCTPYIIHHLNDSGLYSGRYYANEDNAKLDMKYY